MTNHLSLEANGKTTTETTTATTSSNITSTTKREIIERIDTYRESLRLEADAREKTFQSFRKKQIQELLKCLVAIRRQQRPKYPKDQQEEQVSSIWETFVNRSEEWGAILETTRQAEAEMLGTFENFISAMEKQN
eukprot:CAMPEP_0118723374 /NCGR_PEP_ID=MMETSP0800-20121206/31969_1 /TAXON_ID=210618 ORGANISM="Striatella unipunctata, Strain CCMP2910" /NCGR_SAMPLE_ID=MMETSP0800 /ASSEMBLY_ACC=CAM_ASM_000638 /LENGTH=134 /DNA_ID=CAMNT_0006631795 /DNA_START=71 /DNA_END=475 /DNA_ORIENTATION=+